MNSFFKLFEKYFFLDNVDFDSIVLKYKFAVYADRIKIIPTMIILKQNDNFSFCSQISTKSWSANLQSMDNTRLSYLLLYSPKTKFLLF